MARRSLLQEVLEVLYNPPIENQDFVVAIRKAIIGTKHEVISTALPHGEMNELDYSRGSSIESSQSSFGNQFYPRGIFLFGDSTKPLKEGRRNSSGEDGAEAQFLARGFSFSPAQTEADLHWQVAAAVSPRGRSGSNGDSDNVGQAVVP
ncbi:hypothetical protein U1Q18_016319 [Sarracenia purpurea var. burkii]